MSLQKLRQPLSSKSALRPFGFFLLILTGLAGGLAWQKYKTRPLTVAETKEAIRDYLEEKAGVSRFDPAQLEKGPTNKPATDVSHSTDDAAESKKLEKKKKKKTRPPHEQLARDFRQNVKGSPDYKTTYRLIGENLAHVDELLAARDSEKIEAALLLAAGTSRAALDPAVDGWLAARIAEAYLWPNLDHAPVSGKGDLDAESLLDISEDAFKAADETDNLIRNYRLLIARSDRSRKTDKFRVRLAKLLEGEQNFTEALRVLHEVQDTNKPSLVRRISAVEMMLQQAKAAN